MTRYTDSEIKQIQKLFAEGYSATLIRIKIGRPPKICYYRDNGDPVYDTQGASSWLFQMQKKGILPKRKTGNKNVKQINSFLPGYRQAKINSLIQRQQKIPKIIAKHQQEIAKLKQEAQQIDLEIEKLKKQNLVK